MQSGQIMPHESAREIIHDNKIITAKEARDTIHRYLSMDNEARSIEINFLNIVQTSTYIPMVMMIKEELPRIND